MYQIKLLYRASRHGFRAADFHAKCDNRANTITLIQTTKGYIFGGYTQARWTSDNKYHRDSSAFLFSLVNKFNKPAVCRISNSNKDHAIFGSPVHGPIFGNTHDICICDNSNALTHSYSSVLSYERPPHVYHFGANFFSETKYFQVKDIEVFQLKSCF